MSLHDVPMYALTALRALEGLDDVELQQRMRTMMPDEEYERLTELRNRRRDGTLNADEQAELDRLLEVADTLTLEKAYAAALLKWRGNQHPPFSD